MRRARQARAAAATVAVLLTTPLLTVAAPAGAAVTGVTFTQLATLAPSDRAEVLAMNNKGLAVGNDTGAVNNYMAVPTSWTGSTVTWIGTPKESGTASSVNDQGKIVGNHITGFPAAPAAAEFTSGKTIDRSPWFTQRSAADHLNVAGHYLRTAANSFGTDPFIWYWGSVEVMNGTTATKAGDLAGSSFLNDNDQVLVNPLMGYQGYFYSGGKKTIIGTTITFVGLSNTGVGGGNQADSAIYAHAVSWQNGVVTALPGLSTATFNGQVGGKTIVTAINKSGDMVGYASAPDAQLHAVVWRRGAITDLGAGKAYGINNSGQIYGEDAVGHLVVWQNGKSLDIQALTGHGVVSNPPGQETVRINGITDDGHLFGSIVYVNEQKPAIWMVPPSA